MAMVISSYQKSNALFWVRNLNPLFFSLIRGKKLRYGV
ncbi:hypothetical protein HPCPY6261_0286 [Helicobacter pylori CPY6261]|nr:hypothetical protein HPCPY6261_0286 [Helicobacter pylori CPY6261]